MLVIIVAVAANLGYSRYATVPTVFLAILWAGYAAYQEERAMRVQLEEKLRITGHIGSLAQNFPDPGRGKFSLVVGVAWEVWAAADVATDKLALNIIAVRERPWWAFWRKRRIALDGIPPKGQDHTEWRRTFTADSASMQPHREFTEFSYLASGERIAGVHHFELYLVLITGMPAARYVVPVTHIPLMGRGATPPL